MDTNTTVVIRDSGTVVFGATNTITVTNTPEDNIVTSSDGYTIVALLKDTDTITSAGSAGPQGPIGPPGVSEEDAVYSKRVDFISDDLLYKGEATVGSLETDPAWRVRLITISNVDGDVSETWASGTAEFNKIWADRATFTYS